MVPVFHQHGNIGLSDGHFNNLIWERKALTMVTGDKERLTISWVSSYWNIRTLRINIFCFQDFEISYLYLI